MQTKTEILQKEQFSEGRTKITEETAKKQSLLFL